MFNKGERVASHLRSWLKGHHTTLNAHRPEAHQHYGDWSPERFISWAEKIGSATRQVITVVLQERRHPEQGYRSCLGILRLAKAYSDVRLEAACTRALLLGTCRYKSIESILKHGLDIAEQDGPLRYVGSTYDSENDAIYDGLSRRGARVVSFAPVLRNKIFPLPQILELLLDLLAGCLRTAYLGGRASSLALTAGTDEGCLGSRGRSPSKRAEVRA